MSQGRVCYCVSPLHFLGVNGEILLGKDLEGRPSLVCRPKTCALRLKRFPRNRDEPFDAGGS